MVFPIPGMGDSTGLRCQIFPESGFHFNATEGKKKKKTRALIINLKKLILKFKYKGKDLRIIKIIKKKRMKIFPPTIKIYFKYIVIKPL